MYARVRIVIVIVVGFLGSFSIYWFNVSQGKVEAQERGSLQAKLTNLLSKHSTSTTEEHYCGCVNKKNYGNFSCDCQLFFQINNTTTIEDIVVPPNATYTTVNRAALVKGLMLSLTWRDRKEGILTAWRCRKSGVAALSRISTQGLSFAGYAHNDEIRITVHIRQKDAFHQVVTFPDCIPSPRGFHLEIILLHIGYQGYQDPPCLQGLHIRSHCQNETLWMDQFTKPLVISNLEYHGDTCKVDKDKLCTLDSLTPGYWNMTSVPTWTPTKCRRRKAPPNATGAMQGLLLVGDSTSSALSKASMIPMERIHTPVELKNSMKRLLHDYGAVTDRYMVGLGLHSTCYNHMQKDLDEIRPLLQQMASTGKLMIRSTSALSLIDGLDYNDKKCLYYTFDRLHRWNAQLKQWAFDWNITYWDVFNVTASIGVGRGEGWALTDGTHYCKPVDGKLTRVCLELVDLIESHYL